MGGNERFFKKKYLKHCFHHLQCLFFVFFIFKTLLCDNMEGIWDSSIAGHCIEQVYREKVTKCLQPEVLHQNAIF